MGNISGIPAFNPNIQPKNSETSPKELMQEAVALIRDIMDTSETLATHGALINRNQPKQIKTDISVQNTPTRRGEYIPLAEAIAGVQKSEDDDDLKLRKKHKSLKKKLQSLLAQLEDIDLESLPPEDKQTVQQFLKNAKTILNMQRELEMLETKEEQYKSIIEKHKRNNPQ